MAASELIFVPRPLYVNRRGSGAPLFHVINTVAFARGAGVRSAAV